MDKYQSKDTQKLTQSEARFYKTFGKWFLRVGGAVIFVLLVIFAGLLVRLSFGPIDLGFIRPDVEKAIHDAGTDVDVQFSSIQMVWQRWLRPYEIVVKDIKITDPQAQQDLLTIDEVGLSLWIEKLIAGRFEIRNLFIYSPKLILNRRPDSGFMLKFSDGGGTKDISFEELSGLLTMGNGEKSLGSLASLNKIVISDTEVILQDDVAGEVWQLPRTSFTLNRYHDGFRLRTRLQASKRTLFARYVDMELKHRSGSKRVDLILDLKKANFAELIQSNKPLFEDDTQEESDIERVLEIFYGLDFPIQGHIHLAIEPSSGQFIDGEVLLQAGAGTLTILEHKIPINEFSIQADIDDSAITLERLQAQLAETKLVLRGKHVSDGTPLLIHDLLQAGTSTEFSLNGTKINIDSLDKLWPKFLAKNAREWVTQEIKSGFIPQIDLSFKSHVDEAANFVLDTLEGHFPLNSLELNYLDGLPHALNLSGSANFNQRGFQIEVSSGKVKDVTLAVGKVLITGLDTSNEKLELDLDLQGSFGSILDILDHPPLGYAQMAKLDPAKTTGQGRVNLKMAFPLLADLKFADVTLNCNAEISDVGTLVKFEKSSLEVANGAFTVSVDEKHLSAKGNANINKLPAKLEGLVYFTNAKPKPWDVQIVVDTAMTETDLKNIGYDYTEYLHGKATTRFTFENFSKQKSSLGIDMGLKDVKIHVPHIGWEKPLGEAASLAFVIDLAKSGFDKVRDIDLSSDYLSAKGSGVFDKKEELASLDLSSVRAPHFTSSVSVVFENEGGYNLHFEGEKVNAEPLMNYLRLEQDLPKVTKAFKLSISSDVEILRMKDGAEFRDVNAAAEVVIEPDDVVWRRVKLNAAAGSGTSNNGRMGGSEGGISFDLEPDGNGGQVLDIFANDAGKLFRNLDIYDKVLGGEMEVHAKRSHYHDPFVGTFSINNFDATNIPLAGRLASVLSPMGIVNLFSGDGRLTINSFNCDFSYSEAEVIFKEGVGKSIGLGFTTAGKIDRKNQKLEFKGNIIPAYVLNSILDNIPIVGSLLSGGKGEGLFAMAYSVDGPIDDPQIQVNPLTALAPGFIRNIFGD